MFTKFIVSVLIAVVISFLCSLAEAILLSLNPLTMHRLRAKRPKAADSWVRMKKTIARPIAAILILNTIAHTGGATVAGAAFIELYGQKVLWVFSAVFTFVILLGTEILPKIIGVAFRDHLAPYLARPLEITTKILGPIIRLIEKMFSNIGRGKEQEQITTGDIVTLASLARSGKVIGLEQENIIVNAIRLNHTTIDKAMIPCHKVSFIKKSDTIEDIIKLADSSKHTRYPISSTDDISGIYGYVNMKSVLPHITADKEQITSQAKPLLKVQSSDNLMVALTTMVSNRQHLLAVLDSRKNCAGIITMEDIASELLGTDIEMFK
ncbi:MAG: CNNM domain-containing protein [Candidatus Ratteibacteria bacterium]|nr:CNNM domain-containing protein [Candidatus Ratteibacteria bacterium]